MFKTLCRKLQCLILGHAWNAFWVCIRPPNIPHLHRSCGRCDKRVAGCRL